MDSIKRGYYKGMKKQIEQNQKQNEQSEGVLGLNDIEVGRVAVVDSLCFAKSDMVRLVELGFYPGAVVKVLHESVNGDPRAYLSLGAVVAIRQRDAKRIKVHLLKERA